ncbi:hypothetical protein JKF63_03839 [Porcisia hertigi]|uniref:Uncharacterized protein n=1 Tax=Porcisia hertigi TaxID=2761500 RepID=A0A836IKW7_9TRYP|nr:hypothetical protein JKF63_03839 [Porcisia hertigi]
MSRSQLSIDLEDFLGHQAPIPTDAFLMGIRPRAPLPRQPQRAGADADNDHSDFSSWPDPVVAPIGLSSRRRPRELLYESQEHLEAQRRALVGRPHDEDSSSSHVSVVEEAVDGKSETPTLRHNDDDTKVERLAGPLRRLESNRVQLTRQFSEAQVMERQQQELITILTNRLNDMDARFQAQVTQLSSKLEAVNVNVGERYDSIYSKVSESMNARAAEVLRLEQELKALKTSSSEELKSCRDTIIACRADVAKLEGRLEGVLSHPLPSSVAAAPLPSSTPAFKPGGFTAGLSSSPAAAAPSADAFFPPPPPSPSTLVSTGGGSEFGLSASTTMFGGFGPASFNAKAPGKPGPAPTAIAALGTTTDTANTSSSLPSATAPAFGNPFGAKAADPGTSTAPFSFGGSTNESSSAPKKLQDGLSDKSTTSTSTSAFGSASSGFPAASGATSSNGEAKPLAFGGDVTGGPRGAAAQAPPPTSTDAFSSLGKAATPSAHSSSGVTNGFGAPAAQSASPNASPFSFNTGGATAASGATGGNPFMPTAVSSSSLKPASFGGAATSQQAASPVNGGTATAASPTTATVSSSQIDNSNARVPGTGVSNTDGSGKTVFGGGGFPASSTTPTGAPAASFSFGAAPAQAPSTTPAASVSAAGSSSVSSTTPTFGSAGVGASNPFVPNPAGGGNSGGNKMGGNGGAFGSSPFPSSSAFPTAAATPASAPFSNTFGGGGAPASSGVAAPSFGGSSNGGPPSTFSFGGAPAANTQGATGAPGSSLNPPKPVGTAIGGGGFNTNPNMQAFGASAPLTSSSTNLFSGAGNTVGAGGSNTLSSGSAASSAFGSNTNNSNHSANSVFGTGTSGSGPVTSAGVVFGAVPANTSVPAFGSSSTGGGGSSQSAFGAATPAFAQPLGISPAFGGGGGSAMGRMSGPSQGTSILGSSSSRKKTSRRY